MKICTRCDLHYFDDTYNYCTDCGTKLTSLLDYCSKCNYQFSSDQKYCPICGLIRTTTNIRWSYNEY